MINKDVRFPYHLLLLAFAIMACKEPEVPPNPFEGNKPGTDTTAVVFPEELDPNSFAGLHANIFSPTCANSGCHDGTFEPDFRTIESAYNTLVLHPVIKNDPSGSFTYRVVPGDLGKSVIWKRLNEDIDGQSGIMPLSIDPSSDWPDNKDTYLANVQSWIEGGAKDLFGNTPQVGNLQPSTRGVIAFANGVGSPIVRQAETGPMVVPMGTAYLDIWISFTDDQTATENIGYNKIKVSTSIDGFESANELPLEIKNPIQEIGLFKDQVSFYHFYSLDLASFSPGAQVFFRTYIKDGTAAPITEIPADGSADYMKGYFSFILQ